MRSDTKPNPYRVDVEFLIQGQPARREGVGRFKVQWFARDYARMWANSGHRAWVVEELPAEHREREVESLAAVPLKPAA